MGLAGIKELRLKLLLAAEEQEEVLFPKRLKHLQAAYQKPGAWEQETEVFKSLIHSFPKERKAASLGICYRYSDALMHQPGYWLVLYGEDFYLDEFPIERRWNPPGFFDCYEADITAIMSELREDFPRICPYEEEAVRRCIIDYYHAAVYVFSKALITRLLSGEIFTCLNKKDDFCIFFGEYQGEGEILKRFSEKAREDVYA